MGTISLEHSDRLFWLGRYVERTFTNAKALETYFDKMLDTDPAMYKKYLDAFGIYDKWGNMKTFIYSFLFEKKNPHSVINSINKAYDNGIVLREDISTEALSFIQLAMDKMNKIEQSEKGLVLEMISLEDILFSFWGCVDDYLYDAEKKNIIYIGKYVERLDLYFRLDYPKEYINVEFERLCERLRNVPKNTPYRYSTESLSALCEIVGMKDYSSKKGLALQSLGQLFEV